MRSDSFVNADDFAFWDTRGRKVFKLHGSVSNFGSLVATNEDYRRAQKQLQRGTIGAARSNDPNSANSQFFIDFAPAPFLNGKYTIWGQVIDGMDAVDKIKPGEPPSNPDKIVKMQIAADADDASKQAATKVLQAQQ